MKKVLVVAQFTQLPGEKGNNRSRFRYICENLALDGHQVTQVTSSFRDVDKKQRAWEIQEHTDLPYEVIILNDPGYEKNISFQRIKSQRTFAINLKNWLTKQEKFDLIYCSVPPHEAGLVAANYAQKNKIPFIIDVQDLWPEAMKMAFNIPIISNIAFYPMKTLANKVYSMADGIVACSQTYLDRAVSVSHKNPEKAKVFLGTDLSIVDKSSDVTTNIIEKNEGEKWITYTGSLSHSYDIGTLIEAIKNLHFLKGVRNTKLIIMGSGPLEDKFKKHSEDAGINVEFTGWVSYNTMVNNLKNSDVLVNAIKSNAPQSITNKISDYVSAGTPIINGSPNLEFKRMIEEKKIGFNYVSEDVKSMVEAINRVLSLTPFEKQEMKRNSRELAEEEFDRQNSYRKINEIVNVLLYR
ncbi:glycosyltransferase family 4 protein [Planococcus sp. ANT_H30]|uniref:glycosyltransferase family 4 protein n=1 Tax=Planococcus sp. ANT_H30 TaxID=2597347 RepID=UPI0011EDF59D|nr:glycosyltransferase family 4 protein [Planococcus sp. ANT_H30]KAA0958756.1 glycosyltransferase family 4 protein [Planococcus sp. ANT_H30]